MFSCQHGEQECLGNMAQVQTSGIIIRTEKNSGFWIPCVADFNS